MFDRWTGFSALADEVGFILAITSALGEVWNDGHYPKRVEGDPDDVRYLLALLDDVCRRLPIDRLQIYVVGMSNGATMAARLVCEHPARIAAFAQVAGTAAEAVACARRPAVPVSILQVHGTRDRYAPYSGGRAHGLRARLVLRHPAGPCVAVDEWARLWVDGNGVHDGPHTETVPPDATIRRWRGPSPASDVVFYRLNGGGHTWPGNRTWVPRSSVGRAAPLTRPGSSGISCRLTRARPEEGLERRGRSQEIAGRSSTGSPHEGRLSPAGHAPKRHSKDGTNPRVTGHARGAIHTSLLRFCGEVEEGSARPTAERACVPAAPDSSRMRSEKPLITDAWLANREARKSRVHQQRCPAACGCSAERLCRAGPLWA